MMTPLKHRVRVLGNDTGSSRILVEFIGDVPSGMRRREWLLPLFFREYCVPC